MQPPQAAGEHRIEVAGPPEETVAAVEKAAEAWGAELERATAGHRLHLPVSAGLRHGILSGPLSVEPAGGGSRVVFRVEESAYGVRTQAVAILLFAVAGGLVAMLWPFFPKLLPAAPLGAVLALGAWFLVISRLQTSGPDDFLETVAATIGEAAEAAAPKA